MKKVTTIVASAFVAVALLTGINANAQTTEKEPAGDSKALRLGVGLNVGLPTDKDPFSVAIGGDLRLQKDFSSNVSGILSAGFTSFSVKDEFEPILEAYNYIPVKAGIKVFLMERFYASGELGAGFGTQKDAKTGFIYAPGIGVGFNNGLDLGLRYEALSFEGGDIGQVALRIAYGFKLGK